MTLIALPPLNEEEEAGWLAGCIYVCGDQHSCTLLGFGNEFFFPHKQCYNTTCQLN